VSSGGLWITPGGGNGYFPFLKANDSERRKNAESNVTQALQRRSTKQRKKEITARS